MATNLLIRSYGRSLLLDLLVYAGWRLWVRDDEPVRIRATRDGVELDVTAATVPGAAGTVFAKAMRSGRDRDPSTGD